MELDIPKIDNSYINMARKKSFDSSLVTGSVFLSHRIVFRNLILVKRPALKKVRVYTYIFSALKILIPVLR